jgi:DNA-binding NarL/FixJ family response regulator
MIPVLGLGRCLGAASLAEVEAHRAAALACAVAILDINLGADAPSGIDVYEWLRCFHFAGKVVFLTGHGANDPSVRKASSIAATRTLAKPIGVQELVALVAQGRHAR